MWGSILRGGKSRGAAGPVPGDGLGSRSGTDTIQRQSLCPCLSVCIAPQEDVGSLSPHRPWKRLTVSKGTSQRLMVICRPQTSCGWGLQILGRTHIRQTGSELREMEQLSN